MIRKGKLLLIAVCLSGVSILSNCSIKNEDARLSLGGGNLITACGPFGFKALVHPFLRANCGECHVPGGIGNGAHAAGDPLIAYSVAKLRMNLMPIRSAEVSHGLGGCSNCGPLTAQTLAGLIAEWESAEREEHPICQNIGQESGTPFDPGVYTPTSAPPVRIVQAGLTYFTNNVLPILRQPNACLECHVVGGISGFRPHSDPVPLVAYVAAKPVAGPNVAFSKMMLRASTPNHGPGCNPLICGNATFYNALEIALDAWFVQESAGAVNESVRTANKAVTPTIPAVGGGSITVSWNLTTELTPAVPGIQGLFELTFEKIDDFTVMVTNPSFNGGIRPMYFEEVMFVVAGQYQPFTTTYTALRGTIPAFASNQIISVFPLFLTIPQTVGAVTVPIQASFAILRLE